MRRHWWLVLLGTFCACSGTPDRVLPPEIDAAKAGTDAIEQYDKNGNGQIDGAELDAVPALKSSLSSLDKNGDGQVSAEEIIDRILAWQETKTGITQFQCAVRLDGQPLEGAELVFEPEPFLGTNMKPAKATSGSVGVASPVVDDPDLAARRIFGAQYGFYKVKIHHPGKTIPSRYNTDTELGAEVSQELAREPGGLVFELKSR